MLAPHLKLREADHTESSIHIPFGASEPHGAAHAKEILMAGDRLADGFRVQLGEQPHQDLPACSESIRAQDE